MQLKTETSMNAIFANDYSKETQKRHHWHVGGAFDIPGAARPADLPSAELLREFEQHEALSHQHFDDIFEQGRQQGAPPGSAFHAPDHQETRLIEPCLQVICHPNAFRTQPQVLLCVKCKQKAAGSSVILTAPIDSAASSCKHHFKCLQSAAMSDDCCKNSVCECSTSIPWRSKQP